MLPEQLEAVGQWLRKAHHDLLSAEILSSAIHSLNDTAIFHAQQAAEKSLKALLTWHNIHFRKVHDLREIGGRLIKVDPTLKDILRQAEKLTPFAIAFRYPGEDDPSDQEIKESIVLARKVYEAVLQRIPKESHPAE